MLKHLTPINEVSLRYTRPKISKLPLVKNSSTAIKLLRKYIENGKLDFKEYNWILLLTANSRLLGICEFNTGSIVCNHMYIREIMQLSLVTNAAGIIIVHNHPSGDLTPSKSDYESTRKIREIGKLMDINLRDHLIITSESFISIRRRMLDEW